MLQTFTVEKALSRTEVRDGLYTFPALFLAQMMADLPFQLFHPSLVAVYGGFQIREAFLGFWEKARGSAPFPGRLCWRGVRLAISG